jgi:hypothetical protein
MHIRTAAVNSGKYKVNLEKIIQEHYNGFSTDVVEFKDCSRRIY